MSTRRSWAVLVATALVAGVALLTTGTGGAATGFTFSRFAGTDRYDTAAKVAVETYGTSDQVVLTSGENYPDALAGTYAAGLADVPILLTARDALPAPTSTALTTLGAEEVVIVGGTSAVSTAVESALRARNLTVERLAGGSRYETARLVAESGGPTVVGRTGPAGGLLPTAIVVSGQAFPDALSAGPASFASKLPILLTTTATLSPEARQALVSLGIRAVLIVGGTAAVSSAVQSEIAALGIQVTRLAGADRTATAAAVADYELANLGFVDTHVDLARGDAFADALAAGVHAGKVKAPSLLTASAGDIGAATRTWLSAHAATLTTGHIAGGTGAVSAAAEAAAKAAATGTGTTTTTGATSSTSSTLLPIPTTLPTLPIPTTLPPELCTPIPIPILCP